MMPFLLLLLHTKYKYLSVMGPLVVCGLFVLVMLPRPQPPALSPRAAHPSLRPLPTGQNRAHAVGNFGRLPLSFEINQGQTDPQVKFLSRDRGYTLFLTGNEAVLSLRSQKTEARSQNERPRFENGKSTKSFSLLPDLADPGPLAMPASFSSFANRQSAIFNPQVPNPESPTPAVLRMKLVGANPKAKVVGLDQLPGKSNYFIGNDPKKWRTNVASYAKVKYQNVYPGIDLVYYGNQRRLEYDFVVSPGADPIAIGFRIDGTDKGEIDAAGDLVLGSPNGEVRFHKPVVFQPSAASSTLSVVPNPQSRIPSPGSSHSPFTIQNSQLVDAHFVLRLARTDTGNLKLETGSVPDTRHPTPGTSYLVAFELGPYDKSRPLIIDPTVEFMAYVGGAGWENAKGISVDSAGSIYVAGTTQSADFPITPGAIQGTYGGGPGLCNNSECGDGFVFKLTPDGSTLIFSTYFGGSGGEVVQGMGVDQDLNVYIAGLTQSGPIPIVNPLPGQSEYNGGLFDVFVAKLNPTGDTLLYSTYLGGTGKDQAEDMYVVPDGTCYVVGESDSDDYPTTTGAYQTTKNGGSDGIVSKIAPDGSALLYSTYLGGDQFDSVHAVFVDSSGNAYITGETYSSNFPHSPLAKQSSAQGGGDAFVTKLQSDGSDIAFSTYLGGTNGLDKGWGITADGLGNTAVTGITRSTDFPITLATVYVTTIQSRAAVKMRT
jgi:hypothetical protein